MEPEVLPKKKRKAPKRGDDWDPDTPLNNIETALIHEMTRLDENKPTSIKEALLRVHPKAKNWKTQSVYSEGTRLMAKANVKKAFEKKRNDIDREYRRTRRSGSAQVEAALWREVQKAEKAGDRIAALRVLASRLPPEEEDENKDDLLTKEQILNSIQSLVEASTGKAIDITPSNQIESGDSLDYDIDLLAEEEEEVQGEDESSFDVSEAVDAVVVSEAPEEESPPKY